MPLSIRCNLQKQLADTAGLQTHQHKVVKATACNLSAQLGCMHTTMRPKETKERDATNKTEH
jgi:hypothetical protein